MLIQAAVSFGTVIMFGSAGEILTEKSGNLNLGVPGMMYLGGIASLAGSFFYERACDAAGKVPSSFMLILIALVCAFAAAAAGGTNQNVTGLTLSIFGAGIANFFGGSLNKLAGGVGQISVERTSRLFRAEVFGWLPLPETLKQMFFDYGFMVYAAIIIAILVQIFLKRTNRGLNLRSVGESPATADAAGINVTRYKYGLHQGNMGKRRND